LKFSQISICGRQKIAGHTSWFYESNIRKLTTKSVENTCSTLSCITEIVSFLPKTAEAPIRLVAELTVEASVERLSKHALGSVNLLREMNDGGNGWI
jgi:hypothetical protein